jgi:NADH dehydrogenase
VKPAGTGRAKVVIAGAGFAGLSAVRALRNAAVDLTLIDRHNYHLFQPLLYQVATASLSPADIAQPIRSILKDQANARVLLGNVTGIDLVARQVIVSTAGPIDFDYLVIATGTRHSYFGRDRWAADAPGIKSIDDATRVRANVLMAFERAEVEPDPERRRALLTFVIVGGGATGIELAGAIAEFSRNSITRDFRSITPHCARIVLVEAGKRLIPSLPDILSEETRLALGRLGVEVRLGTTVTDVSSRGVMLGADSIDARTIIWAAGVRASPAGEWLGAATDMAGRVIVNADFSVPGQARVFVVGDTAAFRATDGTALPAVAPAAKQAGDHVGRLIAARATGSRTPRPFVYADYGSMATIGRKNAVADLGRFKLRGATGWLVWSLAHIYFLIGFRNRFGVALSWLWSYLTYQRGVRLITGLPRGTEFQPDEVA